MHVLGSVSVTLTIGEHSMQTPVLIVDRLKRLLLSWHSDPLDTLLYARFDHSEPRVLRMKTKKSWMGTFP